MNSWAALWHHFTATLAQQPVAVVLVVWVGLALVAVMALEGLLLNLVPACVFQRYLEKMPDRKKKSSAPPPTPATRPAPVAVPVTVLPLAVPGPVEMPAPAAAEPPAEPAAKKRAPRNRNRKKPAPGPKPVRAVTAWRRAAPLPDRRSRGTPRLLAPKN